MIIIRTEKIIRNGKKARKIIDIKGVRVKEFFGKKYTEKPPYLTQTGRGLFIKEEQSKEIAFYKGRICSEERFQQIIKLINQIGERAHQCRLKNLWRGEETFKI